MQVIMVPMTNLFFFFTHDSAPVQFPGVPFLLGAILMLVSSIFAYLSFKKEKEAVALEAELLPEEINS